MEHDDIHGIEQTFLTFKGKELPRDDGLPIIGSLFKYSKHKVEFIEELIKKHGNKFEFSLAGKEVVVLHGQENLVSFSNEDNITRTPVLPQLKDILGGGSNKICLFLDGQEHLHRKEFLMSVVCIFMKIVVLKQLSLTDTLA